MRNLVTRNRFRHASIQTLLVVACALLLAPGLALGQVAFVQQINNTPSSGPSVAFTNPETAGDFNVVIVGWAGTTSINPGGVTDSNNNTYILAGTSQGHGVTEAIYYAKNISVATTHHAYGLGVFLSNDNGAGRACYRVQRFVQQRDSRQLGREFRHRSQAPAAVRTTTSTTSLIVGAGTTASTFTSAPNGTGLPGNMTTRMINSFGDIAMDSNGRRASR